MDAVQQRRPPSQGLKRFLSTRRGAWTLAIASAALAGLVLLVFLREYKANVNEDLASTPVLTADRLIPLGTAGGVVLSNKMFRPSAVAEKDAKVGALTDAQELAGKVSTREILPGQQITAADFAAVGDPIRSRLVKNERALQIPIGGARALAGIVRTGDRVDIMMLNKTAAAGTAAAEPGVRYMLRNVRVMAVGNGAAMLQVTDRQAAQLVYASENASLWFVLRPAVGATDGRVPPVTASTVMFNQNGLAVTTTPDGETVAVPGQEATP
jgi:Flp pilus assembly protein CpaB